MPTSDNGAGEALDKTLNDVADRIQRVHGAQWDARSDLVRNIVGIAAVIFAGTVTFISERNHSGAPCRSMLLVSCWVSLVLCILAGLYVLWRSVTLRSFYPRMFHSAPQIRATLSELDDTASDYDERTGEVLRQATDPVMKSIGSADSHAHVGAIACLGLFFIAMLLLLFYAISR